MTAVQTRTLSSWRDRAAVGHPHIVDQLIDERTRKIARNPLWALARPLIVRALKYNQAVRLSDTISRLDGHAAMEHMSKLLSLRVEASGLNHIPADGRVIFAPNHPTGLADGVAVYDILKRRRPDFVFFANRDALRVAPGLRDMIVPVEWRAGAKTFTKSRDTVELASQAFSARRAIVIFPSGRLAYQFAGKLRERPWQPSIATLARKYDAPVVPVRISARNSDLFYLLSRVSTDIKDMMLFNELLNKTGSAFKIAFGPAIAPQRLAADPAEAVSALQNHVENAMARDSEATF